MQMLPHIFESTYITPNAGMMQQKKTEMRTRFSDSQIGGWHEIKVSITLKRITCVCMHACVCMSVCVRVLCKRLCNCFWVGVSVWGWACTLMTGDICNFGMAWCCTTTWSPDGSITFVTHSYALRLKSHALRLNHKWDSLTCIAT